MTRLISNVVRLLLLMLFVSTWMGAAVAHRTSGWRTLVLPVVAFVVLGAGYVAIEMLLSGMGFAIESVLASLGITAP